MEKIVNHPPRRLAIASGKGGTGKTTVAVNLARIIGTQVWLLDCDVEEPNAGLFLRGCLQEEKTGTVPVPEVQTALCNGCGECSKFCAYHALVSFGEAPLVFPEMCHGCGGCALVCPRRAITYTPRRIGVIEKVQSENITLVSGRLDVGVAMAPPLIRAVRAMAPERAAVILDAPPGTSCPVIAAIRGVDFVVLVTEPTPFGLHDLRLTVNLVRVLEIPFGVLINRAGSGDGRVHDFCRRESIPVLLEIPDDRRIAEAYSNGHLLVDALPEFRSLFRDLLQKTMI